MSEMYVSKFCSNKLFFLCHEQTCQSEFPVSLTNPFAWQNDSTTTYLNSSQLGTRTSKLPPQEQFNRHYNIHKFASLTSSQAALLFSASLVLTCHPLSTKFVTSDAGEISRIRAKDRVLELEFLGRLASISNNRGGWAASLARDRRGRLGRSRRPSRRRRGPRRRRHQVRPRLDLLNSCANMKDYPLVNLNLVLSVERRMFVDFIDLCALV